MEYCDEYNVAVTERFTVVKFALALRVPVIPNMALKSTKIYLDIICSWWYSTNKEVQLCLSSICRLSRIADNVFG